MRLLGDPVVKMVVFNFQRSCHTTNPQMWSKSIFLCGLIIGVIV
jgi:hypothetical protein